jgi:hypothetical protein
MAIYATNGAKLYIGGAVSQKSADWVKTDFASQTWVEIKETEGLGSLGDTSDSIDFTSIDASRKRTAKGTRSAGTMEVVCGIDPADAGQIAIIAAEKSKSNFAFKLELNDAPVGGTPSERYFIGLVMSQREQFDQANNIMKLNVSLVVNSNVVRVDAAEA